MPKARLIVEDLPSDSLASFTKAGEVFMDCEMMGLDPRRDRLCVVQMAAGEDRLLLQIKESQPYPNLRTLMEDSSVTKVFHFARMDCLFLQARLGITVSNIFCTKVASRLARTYTDRHGLRELVREICQETMDKTNQSSDWGRETLTDDQIYYAEGDVKYMAQIKDTLVAMLKREQRFELAMQCMAFLPTQVQLDRLGFVQIFEH